MKVLIVGLGSIARKHIEALRNIEPLILIYAWRSSNTSKPWEGVLDLFSWEEVQNEVFDFAIISNPTSEHKASITQLLELQIPLFIEKPLFHQLAIEHIVKETEQQGILTYVACNLRFLQALSYVKEYIGKKSPRINEVDVYCGSYLPDWRQGIDYKRNYSAIPELGGGVHIDLIHELDYIYWLFDFPLAIRKTFTNSSSLDIQSYDYANYCLSYPSYNVSVILNYYRRDAKRTLEIICEEETIEVDLIKNSVVINKELVFQSDERIIDTYSKQMTYFIKCLRENKSTFNTIGDAYKVLQICLQS